LYSSAPDGTAPENGYKVELWVVGAFTAPLVVIALAAGAVLGCMTVMRRQARQARDESVIVFEEFL